MHFIEGNFYIIKCYVCVQGYAKCLVRPPLQFCCQVVLESQIIGFGSCGKPNSARWVPRVEPPVGNNDSLPNQKSIPDEKQVKERSWLKFQEDPYVIAEGAESGKKNRGAS